MKIVQNTTDFPNEEIREIIQLARPAGISNFTVQVHNKHNFKFKSWYSPSRHHIKIGIGNWGFSFPFLSKGGQGYLPYLMLSREELFVYNIAHELRHAWQASHTRGRVWKARGRFSDRDADAWAIRMVRKYRRLHEPKDRMDLLALLLPPETDKNTYFESKRVVKTPRPKTLSTSYKVQKLVTFFHCLRCGKEWIPRFPDKEPATCKFCKNPYWNKPR